MEVVVVGRAEVVSIIAAGIDLAKNISIGSGIIFGMQNVRPASDFWVETIIGVR